MLHTVTTGLPDIVTKSPLKQSIVSSAMIDVSSTQDMNSSDLSFGDVFSIGATYNYNASARNGMSAHDMSMTSDESSISEKFSASDVSSLQCLSSPPYESSTSESCDSEAESSAAMEKHIQFPLTAQENTDGLPEWVLQGVDYRITYTSVSFTESSGVFHILPMADIVSAKSIDLAKSAVEVQTVIRHRDCIWGISCGVFNFNRLVPTKCVCCE